MLARITNRIGSQAGATLRIELWHGLMVLSLLLLLAPAGIVEARALLLGALFMGVNFLLLSCGVRWVLTPFATKRRLGAGVSLLILKMLLFLGFALALLLRVRLDPVSFTLGVSTILIAAVADALCAGQGEGP